MMTTIQRLSPKIRLTQAHVTLSQSYRSSLEFQYLEAPCHLTLTHEQNALRWCKTAYFYNGAEIYLYVPTDSLCEFLDPGLQGLVFDDLEQNLQNLFLQTLQRVVENIFRQFKVKLTPKPVQEKEMVPLKDSLCFKFEKDNKEIYKIAAATADTNTLNLILQIYQHKKSAPQYQCSTLEFPFRIRLGQTRLSFQEVKSLHLGDIILTQSEKNILTFYWQNIIFSAERDAATILVKSNLMENTNDDLPVGIIPEAPEEVPAGAIEPSGEEANETAVPAQKLAFPVNQLPVLISFDAGTKHLTFEQLQQLHEGYTFELEKNIDENIDILANGQCIGQGEWVQINERLGVRITHLNLQ